MNRKGKTRPPHAGMVWSRKLGTWVDRDTRSRAQRATDEAIVRNVVADQRRLREVLRQAEAVQGRQGDALVKAAESVALSVLRELMEARRKAGLSQTEVARRMGVPQSAVVRLEAGTHSPTLSTLSRYAAAMGVTLEVRRIA